MLNLLTKRKKIAVTLLTIWGLNICIPAISYALTSGPAQPETKGFQVAGVADMVDLQSGDLKYNIPLLDIDGYPLNLSYQSGTGIDDEASWVGLGWSLNPGAINRQVRGVPDDFSGDIVETDHYVKPKVTVGAKLTSKVEFVGLAAVSGSFTFGIFSDNYTGIGAELGANAGISYSFANDGMLTAGLGAGVLSNTQSGVDVSVSPYVSMAIKAKSDENLSVNAGLSGSFGYNTRSGMKAFTLGQSFGASGRDDVEPGERGNSGSANYSVYGSTITYNTPPISPSIQIPYSSSYNSFSFDLGGEVEALFLSSGGTGYKNVRQVKNVVNQKPAFGFLYAERGMNNKDAVMDFIREKDNPIIPEIPNIALPIHTPDTWSYTSQTGSGQFRLYRGGTGIFSDNNAEDVSTTGTAGIDLGLGSYVHGGVTYFDQHAKTTSRKWTGGNAFTPVGDFQAPVAATPAAQHVYFRQTGEKNTEDTEMNTQLFGTQPLAVDINGVTATPNFRNLNNLHGPPNLHIPGKIGKVSRRPNRTEITYLTAAEASVAGLNKTIPNYDFTVQSMEGSLLAEPLVKDAAGRVDAMRQPHHFSEITVTDDGGKRMVYGIPAYNITQDEYSFAVDDVRDPNHLVHTMPSLTSPMSTPSSNTNGLDNFYHREHKPGYATSFLLSAILSPDYMDKTGDGITDDDLGTAIKFNYSRLPYSYKWRTPYVKAAANRGLLADRLDDKGSIIYGEKEIWYVQSIESKTKIAYFITSDRRDGLGVTDWLNGDKDLGNKQKCLQEIRLYSKADMARPIKVVKFQYDYELCRKIPNSADVGSPDATLGGKLTLKKVWFEYGNSDKGKFHPYSFEYNQTTSNYSGSGTPAYDYNVTDRWGTYKPGTENLNGLDNEQYPYTNQDASYTNQNAALWHLSTITLPTGGKINVTYESGDYAYVQDKKAMVMSPIGLIDGSGNPVSSLTPARGLSINIGAGIVPVGDPTTWFKNTYLDGSDYIYTKMGVKVATSNLNDQNPMPFDFVPTYSLVSAVSVVSGVAKVQLTPITEGSVTANPISISAWQRLKNEYPKYAYPGFENRVKSGDIPVLAAVSAIVNAAKNLTELKKSFYQKARDRGYASELLPNQNFAKITKADGFKLGGGCRVKKIQISDTWDTSAASGQIASYGQAYTYTTTENGNTISSGVATYEPAVGNDENALKQPVPYIEHIKGAINNYFDLELPFGESLYPAPAVGYSKVTVNDLDASGNPSTKTGAVVNEFYTAKDYPVKVTTLPIKPYNPTPGSTYSLTRTDSDNELCLSQGYCIELNDMHGKPKAVRVFNQSGAAISSTVYSYGSTDNGGTLSLNNNVKVIDPTTLQLKDAILGRDVDFFTDFREQETSNKGRTINIGGDVFPLLPFLPFFGLPHFPKNDNNEYKLFRSTCAVKVVQNYGILNKVVKTENGSSITTENIAYDALTGEALVTRTKNEFKKDIYTTNLPAYWVYKSMGAAYQNLGILLSGLTTNGGGEIDPALKNYLRAGDEIVDVSSGSSGVKYWVIYNQAAAGGTTNTQKLIARDGTLKTTATIALAKIVRSGYRNMLGASTTTLVSLNSPISADGHLLLNSVADLDNTLKVINSSATTFDDNWGMKAPCPIVPPFPIAPGSPVIVDTTLNWHMRAGNNVPSTGAYACVDTEANQYTSDLINHLQCNIPGSFFSGGGRLAASNIYPVETSFKINYTVNTTFTVNQTKTYYIGTGRASGGIGFTFDCFDDGISFTSSTNQWTILPIFLTAGTHILTMSMQYVAGAENAFGLEVYNNSLSEIRNAGSGAGINIIYSTAQLRVNEPLQSSTYNSASNLVYHYRYSDGTPVSICPVPSPPAIVNPYVTGFLGNWRPFQTKVFQQSRNYVFSANLNNSSADVKNAGYINNFYPYWYYNGTSWAANPNGTRWVTANTVTLYDKYGQQLENKDALGRFSAAKFDFNGELPSAVASNAMNREIYAASLEDSKFTPGSAANTDGCNIREFIQPSTRLTLKQLADSTMAHSGNYSVLLPSDGVSMATIFHSLVQKDNAYLTLDAQKQYQTQTTPGLYPNGFEPYTGHSYIFDAWVNDALPGDKSVNLALSINGNDVPLQCKAVVEGWKLLEGTIDLSIVAGATALNIAIVPATGKTIYIDDVRMHPFDAHMKTYAYDDKTMRLMAEIDENGFATFYEYDDEGLLIRVKKETEKGIMTLKESRSTYRRNTTP